MNNNHKVIQMGHWKQSRLELRFHLNNTAFYISCESQVIYTITKKLPNPLCLVLCGLSHSVVSDSLQPMDCSPPGSSVHAILQARILECVAISFSRDLPNPGMEHWSPTLQAGSLLSEPPAKPTVKAKEKLILEAHRGSAQITTCTHSTPPRSHGHCFLHAFMKHFPASTTFWNGWFFKIVLSQR